METATMDAHMGGLGAIEVEWDQVREEWIQEPIDNTTSLIGLTQGELDGIDKAVREDTKQLRRGFLMPSKRKANTL